jgi:hypothetical protein
MATSNEPVSEDFLDSLMKQQLRNPNLFIPPVYQKPLEEYKRKFAEEELREDIEAVMEDETFMEVNRQLVRQAQRADAILAKRKAAKAAQLTVETPSSDVDVVRAEQKPP